MMQKNRKAKIDIYMNLCFVCYFLSAATFLINDPPTRFVCRTGLVVETILELEAFNFSALSCNSAIWYLHCFSKQCTVSRGSQRSFAVDGKR